MYSIQEAHEVELKQIIAGADGVIITVDETSDNVTDRSVLNLVLTPISASAATDKTASYIGDQVYVDKLDHKIIAAEVMKVLNKFEINHNDVIAYVSDNVSKAFTLFSGKKYFSTLLDRHDYLVT